jgi:saccharopine dehydrogenase-like NADP-dependent oxidoreductase
LRVAVVGLGAVGRRAAENLAGDPAFDSLVIAKRDGRDVDPLTEAWNGRLEICGGDDIDTSDVDVTVIAAGSSQPRLAGSALARGSHVVCATDDPSEVRALLGLDSEARDRGLTLAVGTVMAPGLSCVLAAYLCRGFDRVEEVHVASLGTGGPACARRHHSALTGLAVDWEDGEWRRRAGGSGRELVWFPGPVGGADCYRAALADPLLLVPAFPQCRRVTSRLEATRRDRVTSFLPMLRPPHPEGRVGAVRVEMRGWVDGRADTRILGAAVAPAVAAGAVSALSARWAGQGHLDRIGAAGLVELVNDPARFLKDLAPAGVTVSEFEGRAV